MTHPKLLLPLLSIVSIFSTDASSTLGQEPPPVWVLHNEDSDDINPPFEDTLQLYSGSGELRASIETLNIDEKIVACRRLVATADGGVLVVDSVLDFLRKIDSEGDEQLAVELGSLGAVASSEAGEVYALLGGTIHGSQVLRLDDGGNVVDEVAGGGVDLVFDDDHGALWIVGARIDKHRPDLSLDWSVSPVGWSAVSVDVASDGTAWVAEGGHPLVEESRTRLLHVSTGGQILRPVDVDYDPVCIRVDPLGNVWVAGGNQVHKYDPAGDFLFSTPLNNAWSVAVDPDGQGVWVGGRERALFYDQEGEVTLRLPRFERTDQTWVAVPRERAFSDVECVRTDDGTVAISWSVDEPDLESIRILHDDEEIALLETDSTSFEAPDPGPGNHRYTLAGSLPGGIEKRVVCRVAVPFFQGVSCDSPNAREARITWLNAGDYASVLLMRDGKEIAELGGEVTEFIDVDAPEGDHEYCLSANAGDAPLREDCCEIRVEPKPTFRRSDADANGVPEINDAIINLSHQFIGQAHDCPKALDADDSGQLEVSDAVYLLAHLFLGASAPPPPFPGCGTDPTNDGLTCEIPGDCGSAGVITWGSVDVIQGNDHDNLRLIRNFLVRLARGREVGDEIRILYTADCDPRVDPELCDLAEGFADLEPFFEMIEELGTIEFAPLSVVSPQDHSVVIADFCSELSTDSESAVLADYLENGGRALVLADNSCFRQGSTASRASLVLEPLGLRFTAEDPLVVEPLVIDEELRVGLLEGVETLDVFRVTPQSIDHSFVPIVESDLGVLAAMYEEE